MLKLRNHEIADLVCQILEREGYCAAWYRYGTSGDLVVATDAPTVILASAYACAGVRA